MEAQGAGLKSSHRYQLEHFNSKLGPEASNRSAMLLALAHLPFAPNSPIPMGEIPDLPENHLGEAVFRAGLEGSLNQVDSKWP
jgi:hypothetical protein